MIAVLHQAACGIAAASAEIDCEHRLQASQPAPIDEFIGTEAIAFRRQPREVEAARPALDRADTVLPVVARHEVAARVAHDGRCQLAHQREHVLSEASAVGRRMSRLEDAAVHAAAEVLDERAEQTRIGCADDLIAVQAGSDVAHGEGFARENSMPPSCSRRPRRGPLSDA
jgi:hypothetical protein